MFKCSCDGLAHYCGRFVCWVVRLIEKLPAPVRKLLPTIILLVIGYLAGATNVFSTQVHAFVSKTLHDRATAFAPFFVNGIIAAILFNIAYFVYEPLCRTTKRVLDETHAEDRVKRVTTRAVKLFYWLAVTFLVITMFAPDLMGKVAVGGGLFIGAAVLALQGLANSVVFGLLMQFSKRVRVGDNIKVLSKDVEGTVIEVGYMQTSIETADGVYTISNKDLWDCIIKTKKPAPPVA